MIVAKVKSLVLSKAAEDKSLSAFHTYFCGFTGFERTEDGCFLSKVKDYNGTPTLDIKLCLMDYCFNESEEQKKLWYIAQKVLGKKTIDLKVIKTFKL